MTNLKVKFILSAVSLLLFLSTVCTFPAYTSAHNQEQDLWHVGTPQAGENGTVAPDSFLLSLEGLKSASQDVKVVLQEGHEALMQSLTVLNARFAVAQPTWTPEQRQEASQCFSEASKKLRQVGENSPILNPNYNAALARKAAAEGTF